MSYSGTATGPPHLFGPAPSVRRYVNARMEQFRPLPPSAPHHAGGGAKAHPHVSRVEEDEKASTLAAATDMIGQFLSVIPIGAQDKGHFREAPAPARPVTVEMAVGTDDAPKKTRGRPKGSKNKPKAKAAPATQDPDIVEMADRRDD